MNRSDNVWRSCRTADPLQWALSRVPILVVAARLLASPIDAAQSSKPGTASQSGVDVVTLKNGRTVRGALLKLDPAGSVTIAVSRDWLQHSNPDLFKKTVSNEDEARKAVAEQLRTRLKKSLETPPDEPRLVFFLKQELERVETLLARDKPVEPEQFVLLDIPHETVSKVSRAQPDRQRVVVWAWSQKLSHVESRETHDLEHELQKQGIDSTTAPPDLSDRLPPRLQDDREWAARMALVEYTLTKPLDFQGTADVLVRSDTERKPLDLAPVLTRVLRSQVDTLLKDLTGNGRPAEVSAPRDWIKSATREADELSVRGLRATRVEVKLDGNQAVVETVFAARLPKGDWETIWSHREVQDATKARPDIEASISSDPQVKQVLETVKSFGLSADDQVRQAIRFGAATMAAQQAADAKFYEFRDRYLQHLDTPPLLWTR